MCLLQLIKPTTEIVESSNTQDLPNLFDHGTLEWGELDLAEEITKITLKSVNNKGACCNVNWTII